MHRQPRLVPADLPTRSRVLRHGRRAARAPRPVRGLAADGSASLARCHAELRIIAEHHDA